MTAVHPIKQRGATIAHALPVYGVLLGMLLLAACLLPARDAAAGIDLVRMEGVIGTQNAPGSVAQLTLAIGAKSIPFSVLTAQRISGMPASAPEIFSALGPGPPPLRVEGRDVMIGKLVDAPADTRVTITGNLDVGNAFLTLMDVEIGKSAGAQ
jgi:hypothetical protein